MAARICSKLGTIWDNRGPRIKTGLYWTRKTKAKAVLIESFFCDSKNDYEKAKKLGFDAHAKLIAEGILGKSISGSTSTTDKENNNVGDTSEKPVSAKYYVQVGAYASKKNAQEQVDKLKKAGFSAIIKEN